MPTQSNSKPADKTHTECDAVISCFTKTFIFKRMFLFTKKCIYEYCFYSPNPMTFTSHFSSQCWNSVCPISPFCVSRVLTFYCHGEAARDLAAIVGASCCIRDAVAPPCERRPVSRVCIGHRHAKVERLSEPRLAPPDDGCSTSCLYCHVGRTVRHRRTLVICNYRKQLCGEQ